MLEYHDGIDVMKPDGLLQWQRKVLNTICGQQPRLQADLKLTNVSQAVKQELARHVKDLQLRHVKDLQLDALSLDVSFTTPYIFIHV